MKQDEQAWLAALALRKFKPVLIEFDSKYQITAVHGNPVEYGFKETELGAVVTDVFHFLIGIEEQNDLELTFLETPNGYSIDVLVRHSAERSTLLITDATQERDQRQALQQKSNEVQLLSDEQARLLDELGELNKALEDKKREAEKLTQLQSQFLASMSHEFRTPLASIITYTGYLASKNAKISIEDGLNAVDRSAKHLLNLVENLIGHAQFTLEGIELNPEPIAIRELCNDIEALFTPIAREKTLQLEVIRSAGVPEYLHLDGMRIRQMIINLLGNACKYTTHGSVTLRLSWTNDVFALEIADTGKGIAQHMLERIFAPFDRADVQDSQGAGLGLHITQRLVELMNGSIAVNSELNQGTSVLLSIPATIAPRIDAPSSAKSEQCVLVVEDDSDVYDIVEIYLDDAGYSVFHADSGQSALEMFDNISPDAVITDLNVPDLSGIDLTEKLRSLGFDGSIIVLTASSLKVDKEKAEAAGCSAYLIKPVSPKDLVAHLTKLDKPKAAD